MKRILVLGLLGLSLAACSSTMGSSGADGAEVDEMKRRILELQKKAAVTEVEIEQLRQKVANLEASSTGMASVARSQPETPVEPASRPVESPPLPDPVPRESIEQSDIPVASVPVTAPAGEDPGTSSSATAPTATPAPTSAPDRTAMEPVGSAAQAIYDQGYTLFHQGRYLDSESAFQRFLQGHPNTDLSDNAQFWIGESRYARSDLRGALAAFRETRQRYPQGNKVPDAMVKEGDCLKGLGDLNGARDAYQNVMRSYPEAAAAIIAEERLAGVN